MGSPSPWAGTNIAQCQQPAEASQACSTSSKILMITCSQLPPTGSGDIPDVPVTGVSTRSTASFFSPCCPG
jgi:hypothetical protein